MGHLIMRAIVGGLLAGAIALGCAANAGSESDEEVDGVEVGVGPALCLGAQPGAYCGNDMMANAVASTLYQCPGAGKMPTSAKACPAGCVVAPPGTADYCKAAPPPSPAPGSYRLPWKGGVAMKLTQDCNDSCCLDHVGSDKWSWDFGNGGTFKVVAARGGTVSHLKMNSDYGCNDKSCASYANFIVVDHGDGTQSTYLHLKGMTLDPAITCGGPIAQGQVIATSGTTGWSSGTHLHFEVSKKHANAPTCECGSTGQGCTKSYVPWSNFWPNATYPTVPITFDEWPATSSCQNRRMTMPASFN